MLGDENARGEIGRQSGKHYLNRWRPACGNADSHKLARGPSRRARRDTGARRSGRRGRGARRRNARAQTRRETPGARHGFDLGAQFGAQRLHVDMRDAPGLVFGNKIHRSEFERLECGFRPFQSNGADHDHRGGTLRHDRPQGGKPVPLRHLDIERHHIGFQLARQFNSLFTITRHAGDLDLRIPGEHTGERCSEKRRIINDKDINQSCLPGHELSPARIAAEPSSPLGALADSVCPSALWARFFGPRRIRLGGENLRRSIVYYGSFAECAFRMSVGTVLFAIAVLVPVVTAVNALRHLKKGRKEEM